MSLLVPNADVMIYNSFGTGTNRRFLRKDIYNVRWEEIGKINMNNLGVQMRNNINMYTMKETDMTNYINPKQWLGLTRDEANKKFTFQEQDFLVRITPENINAPMEFTSDVQIRQYFNTLNNVYAHQILKISPILSNKNNINHFEIAGS